MNAHPPEIPLADALRAPAMTHRLKPEELRAVCDAVEDAPAADVARFKELQGK